MFMLVTILANFNSLTHALAPQKQKILMLLYVLQHMFAGRLAVHVVFDQADDCSPCGGDRAFGIRTSDYAAIH